MFQNTLGSPTTIINHTCFKYTGQSGFKYFISVVLLTEFAEAHVNITHIKIYIYPIYIYETIL
jgi:hypothetical protein